MLTIIFSIITIILGVGAIVLFTQPAFGIYNFNGEGSLDGYTFLDESLFDMIRFDGDQHAYLTVAAVALILALVFAGVMLIITLINLITKATKNKSYVSARWFALFFFIFTALAGIMLAVYCNEVIMGGSWSELPIINGITFSIGWGMIATMAISLLTVIFAPGKNK